MTAHSKPHWLRMLFVWRGSVLRNLLPRLGLILGISVIAVLTHQGFFGAHPINLSVQPFTMLGVAVAIFLGFRNNVCYDRFWEARKHWGEALNATRALLRQTSTLTEWSHDHASARIIAQGAVAFPHLLRHRLRNTDAMTDDTVRVPAPWRTRIATTRFRPMTLLQLIGETLRDAYRRGEISDIVLARFDHTLDRLTDVLGGCERILNTPVPLGYSVLLHRVVYFYCALLPFALAASTGWFTPVVAVFVAYTFLAGDLIAEQLEEPFGTAINDLPLENLSHGIEAALVDLSPSRTDV